MDKIPFNIIPIKLQLLCRSQVRQQFQESVSVIFAMILFFSELVWCNKKNSRQFPILAKN
jgi:hypothetical protein